MNFLDRIGQLNIPNGLAGPPGAAGANGAGWTWGTGMPTGAPSAAIKFYLDVANGQIFEWDGSNWASVVPSIFGTNGNVWIDGAGAPTSVPGAVANDYYLDTTNGDIYQYNGVTWGSPILTIQGTPGTNGVNGTGLLGSAVNIPVQVFNTSTSPFDLNSTVSFNGLQAFPTIGSVVKSTFFVKAKYNNTSLTSKAAGGEVYYIPRIVNQTAMTSFDPNTPAIEQNSSIDGRIMYGPTAIDFNYMHGPDADTAFDYAYSKTQLPGSGTTPSKQFPYAYTKIVTTLVRTGASTITGSVEYTTTTRYATYTANYDPVFGSFALDFSASGGIGIEQVGSVVVASGYPVIIEPIYHIVEKSIL
jgi:hypothetical protein